MDHSLSEERKYYRVSLVTHGLLLIGGIVFLVCSVLSFPSEGLATSGLFLLFSLFSFAYYIGTNRSSFITQTGIGTRWFWKEQFIRWENIAEARPKGDDSLILSSVDQMTILKISGMVFNYGELVEIIRQLSPNSWKTDKHRLFHTNRTIFIGWLVLLLILFGLGIISILTPLGNSFNFAGLIFIVVNLFMLFVTTRIPVSIRLEENELVLKRLVGAVRISRTGIEMVSLGEIANVNTVAMQGVTVRYRDARNNKLRTIQFNNVKEGTAALYASLLDWAGFTERREKPGGGPF